MAAALAIGIAAWVAVRAVGAGAESQVMAHFKNMLGTFATVMIPPGAASSRGMVTLTNVPPTLRFDDVAALAALPQARRVAELHDTLDIDVQCRGGDLSPAIFGVSANWLALRGDRIGANHFFAPEGMRRRARVAVLGADVRQALFPFRDPLGEAMRIGHAPFRVVGLLAPRGAGPAGASLDDIVMIPVTTPAQRLFNRDYLTMIVFALRDPVQGATASAAIRALLRRRHRLAAGVVNGFTRSDPRAVVRTAAALGGGLRRWLGRLAALLTAAGGAVIAALMFAGGGERRAGIGLRRALGARRGNVLRQFLLEAALLGMLGAALGCALGWLATWWLARRGGGVPLAARPSLAFAAALAIAVGAAAGVLPAWRAARLDPARALRN